MLTGKKVLTIDDSATIRILVRSLLATSGAHVEEARDGGEGLALCSASRYDLILLDLLLPDIYGIEVLQAIRATDDISTVVMLTGSGGIKSATAAVRLGADGYIEKQELNVAGDHAEFFYALEQAFKQRATIVANMALQRQLDEQRRQLETELAHAAAVQAELLPRSVPVLEGFEVAARFLPAREVGGDFYDWNEPAPGMLSLTLGDISGKGMPAAIMMATTRAAMRAVVQQQLPADAMRSVAAAVGGDLERAERYVTLFLARLEVAARRLRYVDAGHGHVFLLRADGTVEVLMPRGLPLGIFPDATYVEGTCTLQPGDAVIVYSDGLVDARPELSLEPGALAARLAGAASAGEMVRRLVALAADVSPLPDDLTVLALRCTGLS